MWPLLLHSKLLCKQNRMSSLMVHICCNVHITTLMMASVSRKLRLTMANIIKKYPNVGQFLFLFYLETEAIVRCLEWLMVERGTLVMLYLTIYIYKLKWFVNIFPYFVFYFIRWRGKLIFKILFNSILCWSFSKQHGFNVNSVTLMFFERKCSLIHKGNEGSIHATE